MGVTRQANGDGYTRQAQAQMMRDGYLYTYCVIDALCAALCAPAAMEGGVSLGVNVARVERPQGGGGIDHLDEVQQKRAQTDTHLFCTPNIPLSSPSKSLVCVSSMGNRRQMVRNTADVCVSFVDMKDLRTPRGVSYPDSDICSYNMFGSTISGVYRPLWRSTFDIPVYGELFCDLDYFTMDYSYSDLKGWGTGYPISYIDQLDY